MARRYFALDAERTLKTRFLSLVRRRDAQARQADLERQLEAARNDIEAKTADLRRLEAELEAQRLAQFEATEGLNTAQARFYEASAEVARVEQELKHLGQTRERLQQEIQQNQGRQDAARQEIDALRAEARQRQDEQAMADEQAEILAERAALAGEAFPEIDAAWREAQAAVAAVQREMAQFEQAMQVEDANRAHAERVLDQHKARELRLMQEKEVLAGQDLSHVERQQMDLEALEERAAGLEEYLDNARSTLPDLDIALRQSRQALDNANRDQHRIDAELAALKRMQESAQAKETEGASWLARAGLDRAQRLWQTIRVEPGWETAVEAALGESMAALAAEVREEWLEQPPEGRFEFVLPPSQNPPFPKGGRGDSNGSDSAAAARADVAGIPPSPPLEKGGELRPLASLIHTTPTLIRRLLADRLALAFAADSLAQAYAQRDALPPGGYFATREGHRLSRDTLTFNAPEKGHHGLLARAREIERLEEESDLNRERLEEAQAATLRAEEALQNARRQVDALQTQIQQAHTQAGQLRAEVARGQEALKRVTERRAQVQKELDEIYDLMAAEEDAWNQAGDRQYDAEQQLEEARQRLDEARQKRQTLDQRVQAARESQRSAEREAQEAAFQVRALGNRIKELAERAARGEAVLQDLARQQERLAAELAQAHEAPIQDTLAAVLEQRREAEIHLTTARELLEGANQSLREMDAQRLKTEHALEPLRERFQAMDLKLAEARLLEQRFNEELEGVDEAALVAEAERTGIAPRGDVWLRNELERLDRAVTDLGPVNMAALDELKAADERKQYLDAQAADLETAANTLEDAIRRIDAEPRARLKATYDKVSQEFQSLFQELFGGGHAELSLTGEEILDAGMTVMAQPPGKKNASIQLLSGGEKALTALSLVFAFFRLNPAPFCLLDEVDAPLDDSNTERYCAMVKKMSAETQFLFITHNRITMEMATHLVGVTMPASGVSRPVAVDVDDAVRMAA